MKPELSEEQWMAVLPDPEFTEPPPEEGDDDERRERRCPICGRALTYFPVMVLWVGHDWACPLVGDSP